MERLCTAILLASATAACSVTPANIEQWKTTQKGPDKLAAVLLDDKYTPEIRGRAAIALAEVNSPSSWENMTKAFTIIKDPERTSIVEAMVPLLETMIREGNAPPSPPLQSQVDAKDTLHLLLPYSSGATKTKIEDLLIEWCKADFNQRFFIGKKSIDVIIGDIGPRAAEGLVDLLDPESVVYDKVTEFLDKLASEETQHKAGIKVIEIAKGRIKQYKGRMEEPVLVALGRMGGPEVNRFLLGLAGDSTMPETTQRGAMMAYLQYKLQSKDDLESLYAIAENNDGDYAIRNWAYDAIVLLGDKEQKTRIARLLHLTGADKDRFRGVGVDELIKLLGPEGVPFILGEVVAEPDPWESWLDLRDYVPVRLTQDREGAVLKGEDAKKTAEQLRTLLSHEDAMMRGLAVYALGYVGDASDKAKLEGMKKDKGKLNGWKFEQGDQVVEDFPTVGSVAEWSLKKLGQ